MTTVATRVRSISGREGFDIIVVKKVKSGKKGKPVSVRKNGILGPYVFAKMMKKSATVKEWIEQRFEATYPGYSCQVLKGDGAIAAPQTSLETLRKTY